MVDRPSKWQQTWNILSPYVTEPINAMQRLMTTPYEVLAGGPSPAFDQAVADSLALSGTVTGGSAMIPKPANAMAMGIKAFHGSPHSFDKFSTGKIGTGEGAQAYGHGLYFAENEGVAQGYRKALAYKQIKDKFLSELPQDADFADVEDLMAQGYFTPEETNFLSELRNNDWLGFDYPSQAISAATRGKLDNYDPSPELQDAVAKLGHSYEVDINADPNAFLDWDKPLSEQPANVQTALSPWADPTDTQTTGKLIKYLNKTEGDPAEISEKLREAGVPGIKYLDAGSRGVGDGTRNYVVFDDRLVSIVRKYGIAGASAYLGYDILKNVSEAQAEELRKIEKGTR